VSSRGAGIGGRRGRPGSSLVAIFARRGDSRATPLFNRVRRVAETKMDTPLSRANILTLAAQLLWHASERDAPPPGVLEPLAAAAASRINPWMRGQAAHWLARLGALQIVPENLAPPFAMQLNGDWVGAARAFDELGCPFDRAMALIDGDEAAQRDAFAILESLGATATITRCREMLAGRGSRVPRGPRPSTLANPMGLTERELEVLVLLERGMSNAAIARALSRSEKTVEHHVAAVLAKLDARSRQQAVHIAHSKRLLPVAEP
jgi:DNA-binding CsgD family transcriptional regulator